MKNINNSVFSKTRDKQMPFKLNIFKNDLMKFNHKYTMDGIKLLKNIKDNAIPIVFFDPQYRGILDKMNYGNEGQRQIKRSNFIQMNDNNILDFIKEIDRVLMDTGHLFLWVDKFHLCQGIELWISKVSLLIVDMIVWNKDKMGMGYRTRKQSEYLIVLQKPPIKAKNIWKLRDIRDIWTEKINNKIHPHQKPFELQKILIETVSNEGDVIVDPASGSFSVMDCAIAKNRFFLGCDIESMDK